MLYTTYIGPLCSWYIRATAQHAHALRWHCSLLCIGLSILNSNLSIYYIHFSNCVNIIIFVVLSGFGTQAFITGASNRTEWRCLTLPDHTIVLLSVYCGSFLSVCWLLLFFVCLFLFTFMFIYSDRPARQTWLHYIILVFQWSG